tara:strand:+ start:782 stop:1237 length:456 start_codon:yes stop_codon:yes gene_type:complete
MPLYGTHDQLKMFRLYHKLIEYNKNITPSYYYNKCSIKKITLKIEKYTEYINLMYDILNYEMFLVHKKDILFKYIYDLNELNLLIKSNNLIYDLDEYTISFDEKFSKYRQWVYKYEIDSFINHYNLKIKCLKEAINLHNIEVGIQIALLRK